ncbi:MAG: fused MFS/spermidine synthase [Planctomycetes bacterium]|nr:fused MFS/spermidine synthase [Planctomycetota bacterium]
MQSAPTSQARTAAVRTGLIACALAFLSGFCVMAIEVAAGRMLASFVGAGLYTWTSVIGVVLGGMTLGNLAGGRIADRFDPRRALAVLLVAAALACAALPLVNFWAGRWVSWDVYSDESFPARVVKHVTAVFLLPSAALGLAGPLVAKLALDSGLPRGRTVGNVYAWGALGSIVGTFATGFYLISAVGLAGVCLGVGGALYLAGTALAPRAAAPWLAVSWPLLAGCIAGSAVTAERGVAKPVWIGGKLVLQERGYQSRLYADESDYSYIRVTEDLEKKTRYLLLDTLLHSVYMPDQPGILVYDYEKIYGAVTERYGRGREGLRTLFIGGGGYIFPRHVLARWHSSAVLVSEIDPAVTEANFAAFGLERSKAVVRGPGDAVTAGTPGKLEIHHLDARNHVEDLLRLKRAGAGAGGGASGGLEPFDFAYGDAFNDFCVPFHLVTVEFARMVKDLLRPETGIYLMNVIDIYDSGLFLGAIVSTLEEVFPHVYVLSDREGGPDAASKVRDTFVVIGALRELNLKDLGKGEGEAAFTGGLLEERQLEHLRRRSGGVVLTDDYAPVENLLAPVVRRRSRKLEQ